MGKDFILSLFCFFVFCRFIAGTMRWMKKFVLVVFMAEAMELPMVALQSIKAGAMAHLKGLSCHRQDGRGEWMLAIWNVFKAWTGVEFCHPLGSCLKAWKLRSWWNLLGLLIESTLLCCFNLRLLSYDFIPFIDMMILPSHPASPSLSMIAWLHHCGQISGPSKKYNPNQKHTPNLQDSLIFAENVCFCLASWMMGTHPQTSSQVYGEAASWSDSFETYDGYAYGSEAYDSYGYPVEDKHSQSHLEDVSSVWTIQIHQGYIGPLDHEAVQAHHDAIDPRLRAQRC